MQIESALCLADLLGEGDGSTIKARHIQFEPCDVSDIRSFVEANHYSRNINGVHITCCFKATYNGCLVGAMLFGQMATTAWKKFADEEQKVLELRRLVFLDEAGRNSESRFVGFAIRWIKKNLPTVEVIVSYADPKYGHSGVIYRASNFELIGKSAKDFGYLDPDTGKVYHSRALRVKYKGDYKPFVKRLRDKLERGVLEKIELPPKYCYVYRMV